MPSLADILALLAQKVDEESKSEQRDEFSMADLVADPMTKPFGWQTAAPKDMFTRGDPIGESGDLERILALPRRPGFDDLPDETREAIVELEMVKHARYNEDCRCKSIDSRMPCLKRLLPAQAFILREIDINQGLLAHASVGIGKTLVSILGAMALRNVKTVLLLIPASLRKQLQYDYLMIAEHFKVPNLKLCFGTERPVITIPPHDESKPTLHVLPYSRLSLESESDFIPRLRPDAIICDEVDSCRSMNSARGRRLAKWFAGGTTPEDSAKRMGTRFLGWTGSLTDHSITEFNFLSLFALKDKSPLPLDPRVVEEWGGCLDATTSPSPPGELLRFCEPGEDVRQAYRRRLAETPGFVIANQSSVEVADGSGDEVELVIAERTPPDLPEKIQEALRSVRAGQRPDYMVPGALEGSVEELEDAFAIARAAQEVSCGVLYYWTFPKGESVSLIKEWQRKRRAYNREVREQSLLGETFLDSAYLCEQAAMRFWGDAEKRDDRPEWRCESWPDWRDIRDKVEPQPSSHVIDDFLAQDVASWAEDNTGIIWYTMSALATKIRELTGLTIHNGGSKGEERLRREDGSRSIISSIQSNGRGRNGLQLVFHKQIVVNPPASATGWEQLLGRVHRRNQRQKVVETWLYAHTPELKKAIDQAMRRSEYVRDILGAEQKLLRGWR